jgi:hypothetical protein
LTRRPSTTAILYLLLPALLCGGCSDDPGRPDTPDNNAPVILSCTADPAAVPAGGTTTLSAVAEDGDGDALTYAWTADAGQFPGGADGATVTWTPPDQMGAYTATVAVGDGADTTLGTVTLNVTVPEVDVDPLALDFGEETTALPFTLANDNAVALGWTATADRAWIDVDPAYGDLAVGQQATVTVTVDRGTLDAGDHAGTVTVSTPHGDAVVAVALTVPPVTATPLTNLFFLHHSTGRNLIEEGSVRAHLAGIDGELDFWDHDYNHIGLTGPDGASAGTTYDIPGDNTDPDGLHVLWTTANTARATILASHEVIAFKSCYPASAITSDGLLDQYRQWYLEMRDVFDQHPDKVFVVMSPPPLRRSVTDTAEADRARDFADWLGSAEYLGGRAHVVCFDFFDHLAHPDDGSADRNMLRAAYERATPGDSHPNVLANQTVGPLFAAALADAAGRAR